MENKEQKDTSDFDVLNAADWKHLNENWWHRKYWKSGFSFKEMLHSFAMEIAIFLVLGAVFGIWLY